jgi:dTDP-4-amino-4,6-dideoxygalactose transaminase
MIKLLIPDMPSVDELLPYLMRIDDSRWYANNGPLVTELEARLGNLLGVPCAAVSNGTAALELSLRAACPSAPEFTVMAPAMTFSATGLAALNAGFDVGLIDVDPSTFQITVDDVTAWHECHPLPYCHVAAVMPVAAFGSPVGLRQWEDLHIPVVIDAAGALLSQEVSKSHNFITCFSLHATKFVGAGEGGIVATTNVEWLAKVRSLASFGEDGTNAKMSEYHAAVALAALNRAPAKSARTQRVADWYAQELSSFSGLQTTQLDLTSTMLNIMLPVPADDVIPRMAEAGIETKQWYRPFLDERPEFCPFTPLPVTERIRGHLLGFPFHSFLTQDDVHYVCQTLKEILK